MISLRSTAEGVAIAVDALRSNRVRAFLTILGVAIGVATVTGMASVMAGVEQGIADAIGSGRGANFRVMRFDATKIQAVSGSRAEGKPPITLAEAEAIGQTRSVRSVTPVVSLGSRAVKHGGRELTGVRVMGLGSDWTSYRRGDFPQGRTYLQAEGERSAPVAVISAALAEEMFRDRGAVGQRIRVGGATLQVIGVFKPTPSIMEARDEKFVYLPATTAFKHLVSDEPWIELWVVPQPGAGQARAMDDVTAALRALRHLKPAQENDFALIREEAYTELLGRITGMVTLVMMVLASIGLMVGGVGVVGIMLISVTERTREIGVRKALGARRREIVWQFLVEAITVTVIGAVVGLVMGAGGGLLIRSFTPIPAVVPLWSVLVALLAAAFTGVVFGLYPAWTAARMDPVEALRYD